MPIVELERASGLKYKQNIYKNRIQKSYIKIVGKILSILNVIRSLLLFLIYYRVDY